MALTLSLDRKGSPQYFSLRFLFTASDLGQTIALQSSRPLHLSVLQSTKTSTELYTPLLSMTTVIRASEWRWSRSKLKKGNEHIKFENDFYQTKTNKKKGQFKTGPL